MTRRRSARPHFLSSKIAALRLDLRVKGSGRLKVHGHLSTHVLNVAGGHPAEGVAIELCEVAAGGATRTVKRAVTNADGRTDQPLFTAMPIRIATYELRFAVSDYFAGRQVPCDSAVSRRRAGAFFGRGARGQVSCAAFGLAVGLFDLSRQLKPTCPAGSLERRSDIPRY